MGTFINRGNKGFRDARNGEYVDKSDMIAVINRTLDTERRCTCVSRCRRFGKSMVANMLCAYYDESCDSRELFSDLEIAKDPTFEQHLNKYLVIYLDITSFTTKYPKDASVVKHIQEDVIADLLQTYPSVERKENDDLMDVLVKIVNQTHKEFIMIIDEWDAICREHAPKTEGMDAYLNLMRRLFKGQSSEIVFAGVYATGILPIKKYQTQSALNNFREYSMVDPGALASSFGFTQEEVEHLAEKNHVSMEDLKTWYDGYKIGDAESIYNPYSVIEALSRHKCRSYWQKTGAYDSVKTYIQMNFDGLKDDVLKMLAGGRCAVNTTKFQNDMSIINCKDDVLTVLIHLGYLAYDWDTCECYIPNKEVSDEFVNAVEDTSWTQISKVLQDSRNLLSDTLESDEDAVAKAIDLAHDENTSILSYNNENSLACVLTIAYIWARNEYVIHRELATGKGFADLVMIPRRNVSKPALVIELKFDQNAIAAISQIKQKNYPAKISEYTGDILLVGINYDKENKRHSCKIEPYSK